MFWGLALVFSDTVRAFAAAFLLLLLDAGVIVFARKLLYDFLRGGCSRKRFRQIAQNQPVWRKITLAYVKAYIREPAFLSPFRFYWTAYCIFLALLPCKMILSAVLVFSNLRNFVCPAVYSLVWFALFSVEAPGQRHSRYAGRKHQDIGRKYQDKRKRE